VVAEVPVAFRRSAREGGESRLIGGVGSHILKSLATIVRTLTTYRPLAVLGRLGLAFIGAGLIILIIPISNWIAQGDTEGHLQSLIAAGVLGLVGLQLVVFGLLADSVSATRRLTEEVLYLMKADRVRESAAVPPFEPIQERGGVEQPGIRTISQVARGAPPAPDPVRSGSADSA
ncbi:MAG TPA: hypothetical protein VFP30_04865, partial [Candidatus Limnocylindria bacterium]|nr:hypothetical protein [Candidatus Limnocylindria bacterium]